MRPTEQICHDVVAHDHRNRKKKPEYALKCVLYYEVGRAAEHEEGDVSPGKLRGRREEGRTGVHGSQYLSPVHSVNCRAVACAAETSDKTHAAAVEASWC